MKGNFQQLQLALTPLGEPKVGGFQQLKFNCPNCELLNNPPDKYNLEVSYFKKCFHCWCCNIHGSLHKIVKLYGYNEYAIWFKEDIDLTPEEKDKKILELPKTVAVALNKEAHKYLLGRNIHPLMIKQRNVRYCYTGYFKNQIIFPSYNNKGELTYYVAHSFLHGKYQERKSHNHTCFFENQIDKNIPIILTEGVYDALSVPNAIPLLGLKLNKVLLDFLAGTDVIIAIDSVVHKTSKIKIIKQLNSVCNSVTDLNIDPYKDLNDAYIKDSKFLKNKINECYATT